MRAIAPEPAHPSADTVAVGLFADGGTVDAPEEVRALVDAGEAKGVFKHLAVTHAEGRRWVVVGLGERERLDGERARIAAATVHGRVKELGTRALSWVVPPGADERVVGGLVEGTLLAAYRFTQLRTGEQDEPALTELLIESQDDAGGPVARAEVVATAMNAARDLQNTPANLMTPTHLARRAEQLAGHSSALTAEVEGREQIVARGMGAFAAVAQGTYEEPALITLTYEGAGPGEPVRLGLVGKAVTFDTGGISIKPAAKMAEMKFDMSGGAAVLEAMGAIAALELPINAVAVIGATENMPSGRSMKPGDVLTAMTGLTIEVDNTDAEGRLVLADCLARAVELGAERLVDVATLTGAIVTTFGSTHTGLMSNDDAWAADVAAAGDATGDLVWRLPLHEQYAELVKGTVADLVNAVASRKAGSITAAEFLHRFVGDTPWAHLDIAGTAWDAGRAYAPKGGSGAGVRLLVEVARRIATSGG